MVKASERFVDARHCMEGKAVAVALTVLLAASSFTPSALAMADEMESAAVSDKTMPTVERAAGATDAATVVSLEVEHATVFVGGQLVAGSFEAARDADLTFAVRADEGFQVEEVSYNGETVEMAGVQRSISTEPSTEGVETVHNLYVISADQLAEGAVLKVKAAAMADDNASAAGNAAGSPADSAAVGQEPGTTASVGAAVQDAIKQGVANVANTVAERVQPIIVLTEGESALVRALLWQGTSNLGNRTVNVPLSGDEVSIDQIPPVAEPVFNFGSDRYVLNGKVAVVPAEPTLQDIQNASARCNDGGAVTALRMGADGVQYKTAHMDWEILGDDYQLVYFCSKLQNTGENKGILNVAVEEDVLDAAVEGGHSVQVFVFDQVALGAGEQKLLSAMTLNFDAAVTGLPQGVNFKLGDGTAYEAMGSFIGQDGDHGDGYTADEAFDLAVKDDAIPYNGEAITWDAGDHCVIAVVASARSYHATYDANGAEGVAPQGFAATVGESVTLSGSAGMNNEGHYLIGWRAFDVAGNDLGIYEPGATFAMPANDVILKAQWEAYEGEKFFTARFVWTDENGKQAEIESRHVTTVKVGGEQVPVTAATEVTTDSLDCPVGYHYASAGNAPTTVNEIGRTITFYCEKNTYKVSINLYCGESLYQSYTTSTPIEFGTEYAPEPLPSVVCNNATYIFDEANPNNKLSVIVGDNEGNNVINQYYAEDSMGVADPSKGDGVPDKYQVKVAFAHDENCVWADGATEAEKYAVVNRYNADGELAVDGVGHLSAEQIPGLVQTDGLLLDESCHWPTEATEIASEDTFYAVFTKGNFPYAVRYVDENDNVLDEVEGKGGFESPIPYDATLAFEGYAFDGIENAEGTITSDASKNVVTVRYGTDAVSEKDPNAGDGIPDKYQAVVKFTVENGLWADTMASDERIAVITLMERVDGAWAAIAEPNFTLPGAVALPGYENGMWEGFDAEPVAADLIGGAVNELIFAFQPQKIRYMVIYCKDSAGGEMIGTPQMRTADFGSAIPWSESMRPLQGFSGAPVFEGVRTIGLNAEDNVMYVIFQRDTYTVRGALAAGSHGTIRGNAEQSVKYGRDSETMTFVADEGYRVASVVVNGQSQPVENGQTTYEFKLRRVTKDSSVLVTMVPMGTVVVEAPSASKVYDGMALKAGAAQISGVPEGFTATAEVAGSRTDAGTSAAVVDRASVKIADQSGNDVTGNFQISAIDGTLTVERAHAIVNVDDARKAVGANDPTFTGRVIGLAKGDELADLTFVRSIEGESAGVYLNALTAEYTYNPNYDVTVVPGTFTIGQTVLTPGAGQVINPTDSGNPTGGLVGTVYRAAAAADELAQVTAGTAALSEPEYADVVLDDATPMVTRAGEAIEDDETALGAFDEPKCWVHWLIAMGILLTLGYAGLVVSRRLGYARKVSELDDSLTGGQVAAGEQSPVAVRHMRA